MKRIVSLLIALVVGIVSAVVLATPASAGTNMGRVRNYSGEPVKVWCDYGKESTSHYLIERYPSNPKSNSTYWCKSLGGDTDQFMGPNHMRCVRYDGPGYRDGMYKLRPGVKYKVAGLALAKVYAYTAARCGSQNYFNYR